MAYLLLIIQDHEYLDLRSSLRHHLQSGDLSSIRDCETQAWLQMAESSWGEEWDGVGGEGAAR